MKTVTFASFILCSLLIAFPSFSTPTEAVIAEYNLAAEGDAMINFQQISKQYCIGQQQVNALSEVSGQIAKGEMVALCGPSGSGKSTLLNILGLLDMDYQGIVELSGQAYPKNPLKAAQMRRHQLGFVFQKFNLIPVMTAWENVAYPLMLNGFSQAEQKKQAQAILAKVGLAEFANHRPDNLSGGQQQRVAIARALVHKPQMVIADEPTASLMEQLTRSQSNGQADPWFDSNRLSKPTTQPTS